MVLVFLLVAACERHEAPQDAPASKVESTVVPSAPVTGVAAPTSEPLRAAATPPKPPVVVPDGGEFAAFWQGFRTALLASDWGALERMSRFPVEVKGELDDEPVRKVERAGFTRLLQKLLHQKAQTNLRITVRESVEQMSKPEMPAPSENWARVDEFEFERSAGQWRFVSTYLDSDIAL